MDELSVYGKDGLFHNITKVSGLFGGRYTVLPKGAAELNANNVLTGIDLPQDKYPLVACLPPLSLLPGTTRSNNGERFAFRLLFLASTYQTGDNKIKSPDPSTNTSMHTIPMDWNDMKIGAVGFLNALESLIPDVGSWFGLVQKTNWTINRISEKQVDGVSGVMVTFHADVALPCSYPDYNTAAIVIPTTEHQTHYH